MVSPSQPKSHLTPLSSNWTNRSNSSLSQASEAGTFHSAHANLEMRPISQNTQHRAAPSKLNTTFTQEPNSIKMDRVDSGYSDTQPAAPNSPTISSSRRTSTSSRQQSPRRRSANNTNPSSISSRPSIKRVTTNPTSPTPVTGTTTLTSTRTSLSGRRPSLQTTRPSFQASSRPSLQTTRPSLQARHTTSSTNTKRPQTPYQFFQFPTLDPSSPPPPPVAPETTFTPPPPPPPPATIQYWTSDSTRRLEYAAIDAASRGVRGFFIKLVPDCFVPVNAKRTKFHNEEGGDADSDAGSVRRYRLVLAPEEKGCENVGNGNGGRCGKPSLLRRWTSWGRV